MHKKRIKFSFIIFFFLKQKTRSKKRIFIVKYSLRPEKWSCDLNMDRISEIRVSFTDLLIYYSVVLL